MRTFALGRVPSPLPGARNGRSDGVRGERRRRRRVVIAAAMVLVAGITLLFAGTGFEYEEAPAVAGGRPAVPEDSTRSGLTEERVRVLAALRRAAPRAEYIVIDRTHNRLSVRNGDRVLLSAVCSCGSGIAFSHGDRRWVFDTPPGVFEVRQMQANPVWRKPDWAFLEEGRSVPADASERFDYDALGEYALHFGNGYMIHGTLYERLLGRSVTHGCVRLGRDDLRRVWGVARVGTPIFIF